MVAALVCSLLWMVCMAAYGVQPIFRDMCQGPERPEPAAGQGEWAECQGAPVSQSPHSHSPRAQSPVNSRGAHTSPAPLHSLSRLSACHTRSTRTSSPTWKTAQTPTMSTAPTSTTTTTTTSPATTTTTTPSSRTRITTTGQGPRGRVSTPGPSPSPIRGQCRVSITSCTTGR